MPWRCWIRHQWGAWRLPASAAGLRTNPLLSPEELAEWLVAWRRTCARCGKVGHRIGEMGAKHGEKIT